MFSSEELSMLTLDYFEVKMCVSDVCELVSQNGDHWMILKQQMPKPKQLLSQIRHFDYCYVMYHKHKGAEGFHLHSTVASVLDAVLEIICHDDYRLGRKRNQYFYKVLNLFS